MPPTAKAVERAINASCSRETRPLLLLLIDVLVRAGIAAYVARALSSVRSENLLSAVIVPDPLDGGNQREQSDTDPRTPLSAHSSPLSCAGTPRECRWIGALVALIPSPRALSRLRLPRHQSAISFGNPCPRSRCRGRGHLQQDQERV